MVSLHIIVWYQCYTSFLEDNLRYVTVIAKLTLVLKIIRGKHSIFQVSVTPVFCLYTVLLRNMNNNCYLLMKNYN